VQTAGIESRLKAVVYVTGNAFLNTGVTI